MRTHLRRVLGGGAAIAAGLVVAACGNAAGPAAGATTGTPGAAAVSAGSAAPGAPGAPGAQNDARTLRPGGPIATKSSPVRSPVRGLPTWRPVPVCTAADLRLTLGGQQGAAGTLSVTLVLSNFSGHTCTLQGFPAVAFVPGPPQTGGAPFYATPEGSSAARVTLAPGATASTFLLWTNPGVVGSGSGPAPTWTPQSVRVTPPGSGASLPFDWIGGPIIRLGTYGGVRVQPLVAGSDG